MYSVCVITVSDTASKNKNLDTAGPRVCELLKNNDYDVIYTSIVSDDIEGIKAELIKCSDEKKANLIITVGGTGFSPRDNTPEATLSIIEKETRGISEMMRSKSLLYTDKAILSRAVAGIRKKTLIINLPGSEKASVENLQAVIVPIKHGIEMLLGSGSANCGR